MIPVYNSASFIRITNKKEGTGRNPQITATLTFFPLKQYAISLAVRISPLSPPPFLPPLPSSFPLYGFLTGFMYSMQALNH
jgi:hypothetical protein